MKKITSKLIILVILFFCTTSLFAQTGDADGDGVVDADDLCPTLFGTKANKGCPEENKNEPKNTASKGFGFVYKTNEKDSVLVTFVLQKSPSQFAGIKAGDLIQSFNDINILIKAKNELFELIKNLPTENTKIILLRNGLSKEIVVSKVDKSLFADACLSGNCTNGSGTFQYAVGDKYIGDFKNGVRSGKGKMYYANGALFNGTWDNDYKSGYGEFSWGDGKAYKGYYKDGKYSGKGTYTFANGDTYIGDFENNNFNGYGELKKINGTVEMGNWVANVIQENTIAKNETTKAENGNISRDQFNADEKKYSSSTAQKMESLKKNSEELKKVNPYNEKNIANKEVKPATRFEDMTAEDFNAVAKQVTPEYRKAVEDAKKDNELNYPKIAGLMAVPYLQENKFEQAIKVLDEAIKNYPKYAANYNLRGIAKKGLKDYSNAILDFTKAIQLESNNAEYYLNRAMTRSAIKDYSGSIPDYDQAILKGATDKRIYLNRGIDKSSLLSKTAGCDDFKIAKDAQVNGAERAYQICGCK